MTHTNTYLVFLGLVLLAMCGVGCAYTPAGSDESQPEEDDVFAPDEEASDSGNENLGLASCAPVAQLVCGAQVVGDTSDFNSGSTSELDAYPIVVGNYESPEIAYMFKATSNAEVSFSLVDPEPTSVDHDIFLLSSSSGCNAEAAMERGHNSIRFSPEAGQEYYLVVDGYNGDEGEFALSVDCDPVESASPPAPDPSLYGECLFGWTSSHLESAPHLLVDEVARYEDASLVPELLGQQLVQSIREDGWASPETVDDVFEYVDPDGLYLQTVLETIAGSRFTWLRFYAGDTEVGYIYREGGGDQVALVSDGDVYGCSIPLDSVTGS